MKKYFVTVEGSEKKCNVEISGENMALIDGNEFYYEHKFINDNTLILRINGKNFFYAITEDEENNILNVDLNSVMYKVSCRSEMELMIDKLSGSKSSSKIKKEIHSPMPGIIKSLSIKEGQKINKGEVLLVLEAMKMENEIKASRDCVIKKINVEAMSSVEKNELLIIME
ncbi:MAG: acetyl-CoA carboxylase biotin carboxyl carrier protein subunit [Bacteroidota bacterium]|nr:acetyl-CoA carboxylase biotin carboxyl carrier protein subunit [Bacteroidota bacterium]